MMKRMHLGAAMLFSAAYVVAEAPKMNGAQDMKPAVKESAPRKRGADAVDQGMPQPPAAKKQKKLGLADADGAIFDGDGNVLVTIGEIKKFAKDVAASDQQWGTLIEQMPEMIMPQLIEVAKQKAVINKWAIDQGIEKTADFKHKLDEGCKAVREMLYQEKFVDAFKKEPTKEQIRAYYDQNKSIDPLVVTQQPGIKARIVTFDNESAANDYAAKVKADVSKAVDLAKTANGRIADLGLVGEMSMVDPNVKEALQAFTEFPGVAVVKAGEKEFIVVIGDRKQEGKYKSFAEVEPIIKQRLAATALQQAIAEATEKLSQQYKIVVNEEYVTQFSKKAEEKMAAMQKEMQAAQEEEQKASKEKKATKNGTAAQKEQPIVAA